MTPELMIAGVMLVALVLYTLTGGADFGGGVWELLAAGPRKDAQRRLIDDSIKPIWEANHVWLILLIVLLFVCFPTAFAAVCTALHLPLALMLVGIVLRGSAFVFSHYDPLHGRGALRWGGVFAVASLLTPITLGVVLGALGTGFDVDRATGLVDTDFLSEWLAPYPLAVGLFTLALFAFLAAVYLVREAEDPELRADFRARALGSAVAVGATALVAYLVAPPVIRHDLSVSPWATPLHLATGFAAVTAIYGLWTRRDALARASAMAQVTLIVVGWAVAQYPYLAYPGYTIAGTAAPASVLTPILVALAVGGLVLFPSLAYLFVVFKRRRAA
ncbi:cytochrome bd-I ubiquinol oxidase subunit 2 apoprotein [Nannocystis exedens]|uniref:Cytochrome bd-I ubiquinol oxidase subunit 2 apoprotein n=1 Tax=Nannocystis exedens TaxID=54 RepID=A0A1I1WV00_9BACT|nr:cytochrome d ubiquinol oxidase subunit II [Nannocystis exedens]PCC70989.1 cytochrome bd ubiquinol oxidase subunit II [Nannocystis exedens]SFD98841.1 cytochrome bd-I ubiquinol oxidase subunit 2 apoprotein [Nannocystis exedens]